MPANPFQVTPLGGFTAAPQLQAMGEKLTEKRRVEEERGIAQRAAEKTAALRSKAADVFQRGDPDEINRMMFEHPELGEAFQMAQDWRDESDREQDLEEYRRMMTDMRGSNVLLEERATRLESAGQDATDERELLAMYEEDPERFKEVFPRLIRAEYAAVASAQEYGDFKLQTELQNDPYEGLASGYETYLRAHKLTASPESYDAWTTSVIEQKKAGAAKTTINLGSLTKGQTKIDEVFANEYVAYVAAGGKADTLKQINQLKEVSTRLGEVAEGGKGNLTGPFLGRVPDVIRSETNPESIAIRERVEEVVQRNLRLILGAQFTEKEGIRLIKRAYNENLEEGENKRRVDALMRQMTLAMEAKDSAAAYMEEHGTLKGWRGKMPTIGDFEKAVDGKTTDYGDGTQVRTTGEGGIPDLAAPTIKTKADRDKLPAGTLYLFEGKTYRKK